MLFNTDPTDMNWSYHNLILLKDIKDEVIKKKNTTDQIAGSEPKTEANIAEGQGSRISKCSCL